MPHFLHPRWCPSNLPPTPNHLLCHTTPSGHASAPAPPIMTLTSSMVGYACLAPRSRPVEGKDSLILRNLTEKMTSYNYNTCCVFDVLNDPVLRGGRWCSVHWTRAPVGRPALNTATWSRSKYIGSNTYVALSHVLPVITQGCHTRSYTSVDLMGPARGQVSSPRVDQ